MPSDTRSNPLPVRGEIFATGREVQAISGAVPLLEAGGGVEA